MEEPLITSIPRQAWSGPVGVLHFTLLYSHVVFFLQTRNQPSSVFVSTAASVSAFCSDSG